MEARYFRYQYENTQDGILQSGCIWDRRVDKKTTYLYAAGEYAGIPRIARIREKKWGRKRAGDNLRHLCSRCIYRSIYLPSVRNIAGAGCKNRSPSLYTADDPAEYDDIYRKNGRDRPGITKILGAPYSYLKEQGVENIYLLYGNGPMLPREQDALLEGHYFERVDRRIQEMVTEMEGVFIPVYYAGIHRRKSVAVLFWYLWRGNADEYRGEIRIRHHHDVYRAAVCKKQGNGMYQTQWSSKSCFWLFPFRLSTGKTRASAKGC